MPIYEYECGQCGAVQETIQPMQVAWIACYTCGQDAHRIMSLPVVRADSVEPYYDHGLGTRIESRSQRQRLMKSENVVEKGTTEMSGAKGTIYSHPGRATESVPKSGAQLGPLRG
jgi:putative FmdB family regulatory protein